MHFACTTEYHPGGAFAAFCIQGLQEKWPVQDGMALSPKSWSQRSRIFVPTKLLGIHFLD